MRVRSPGQEDPLEKEMATDSNILVRKIPWTEEPGGLQTMGLRRVGHYLATKQEQLQYRKLAIIFSELHFRFH